MPKAFISGAPDNHAGVAQLVAQLRAQGYQISIHPVHFGDRQSWDQAVRDIAACDVFIPIVCADSVKSRSASRQFDWAERLAKPVLPVLVAPPAKALPARLVTHRIVDYSHFPSHPHPHPQSHPLAHPPHDQSASMLTDALASLPPARPLPDPLPQPPAAPRSGAWKRISVSAAAVFVIALVVGLVMWLTVVAPASHANAIKIVETKDGVVVGSPRAATAIDVFEEPLCPSCARLTASSDADIQRAVNDRKIAVRYHLLNFEDHQSASGDYSTRAIAATLCVADANDANRYQAFRAALLATDFQPKRKPDATTDHTDADLANLAQTVGAASSASSCITGGQRVSAARDEASNAEDSSKRLSGTDLVPMIYTGTREVDYANTGWIDNLR